MNPGQNAFFKKRVKKLDVYQTIQLICRICHYQTTVVLEDPYSGYDEYIDYRYCDACMLNCFIDKARRLDDVKNIITFHEKCKRQRNGAMWDKSWNDC